MRVDQNLILVPVLAQVLLTLVIMLRLGWARRRSMMVRRQRIDDVALATDADWSDEARQCANSYKNQFEMPVLFYAACAFALVTRSVDVPLLLLALGFVSSRVVHAAIHTGRNRVYPRFMAFLAGVGILTAMWALIGWRTLAAGLV